MTSIAKASIVLTAVLGSACAHVKEGDQPEANAAVEGLRSWVARLPTCTPEVKARAVGADRLARAPEASVVVRGVLAPGTAMCTLMACERACCNACSGNWVIVPPGPTPAASQAVKELPFRGPGDAHAMTWSAMDCALRALHEGPRAEVIASGVLRKPADAFDDQLFDATLCEVR